MRRTVLLLALPGLLAASLLIWNRSAGDSDPAAESLTPLRTSYLAGLDSLQLALEGLSRLSPGTDVHQARSAFRRARAAYKRIEYLVEYDDRVALERAFAHASIELRPLRAGTAHLAIPRERRTPERALQAV